MVLLLHKTALVNFPMATTVMKGTKHFFHFRSPVPHPFHQVPASEPLRLHEIHELPRSFNKYPAYPTPSVAPSYPPNPSPSPLYNSNGFFSKFGFPAPTGVAPVAPAAHPVVPFSRNPKSLFQNHFSYLLPRA